MEAQSSNGFAEVVEPNLWYGDSTRLTPKQEEAALGLSRACGSGIPAYIFTMKKSNIVMRQMTFSRQFSKRYIFARLGTYGCETQVFAGRELFGSKINFSMLHGELRLLGGWPIFVKDHHIEAGHVCAFMFEEEEEGNLTLGARVRNCATTNNLASLVSLMTHGMKVAIELLHQTMVLETRNSNIVAAIHPAIHPGR